MKKVLIVSHVSGFLPQFEMENVKILQGLGYEVHYAANFKNPQYGNDNSRLKNSDVLCHQIDFARSPFRVIQNMKAYKQMRRLLNEEKYSILHCHTPVGGAIARLASTKCKNKEMKVIYTVHGFHFFHGSPLRNWLIYYPIERILARLTDILITINDEDYKLACGFKLKRHGEVKKINGVGIEVDKFKDIFEQRYLSRDFGSDKKITFLSVGELNSNKNHRLVIEALHKSTFEKALYIICGEGSEKQNLKKLVKKYNLERQVRLIGYKKDVKSVLRQADVFIMPSFREGLSVALQEAMATGLPIIATDIRGNNELIDEGKGGWLIPSNDVETMAERMIQIENADIYSMGKYNFNKIQNYDKKMVALAMRDIYCNMLQEDLC
ncbi:glycosyl transferase group 1 [[Clostridium] saccharolyticum WM1]|uniref:Glycosyl transferase group 1 n=2 Tax=Lacrimispora TaxID=2719231 RepID=D9R4I9_LACSW|nr:glycosyltransferase family 4 protein [Lacrimispora saccharolytica]ADL03173.1 glycosyl transferase group 1 [[Clostridium] saccharolyticum WM1]QRV18651.1 glycosyltransferase family 4 protein [Lacrimispora saccharolytica]